MPEGPEVYGLYIALGKLGLNVKSYGKHLYFVVKKFDYFK
jgi:hypothetical protein